MDRTQDVLPLIEELEEEAALLAIAESALGSVETEGEGQVDPEAMGGDEWLVRV